MEQFLMLTGWVVFIPSLVGMLLDLSDGRDRPKLERYWKTGMLAAIALFISVFLFS